MDGIRIAQTALNVGQTSLDVSANNLANLNTSGFKSSSTNSYSGPGGRGVETGSISENTLPGPREFTGRPLDISLQDGLYFAVRTSNGRLAFTRDGSFTVDGSGQIVTQNGDRLEPPLQLPSDSKGVSVGKDGQVSVLRGDGAREEVGKIQPVRFPNSQGLEKIGNNLAVPTAASGAGIKVSGSEMFSGALERSNTDIADEMINQIKNERFIEANTKIVKTEDENLGTLIDMKS